MMQLLLPLGLLGFLGVLALIIIYIIRPNYQTRHINSTHIWKLSLNYKKKRLPTSKLRNVLLFLCQVLILTAITMILTQPAIVYQSAGDENELIAIIDSSMSMYTETAEGSRFNRAIDMVVADCKDSKIIEAGGCVSVIIADESPFYFRSRVSPAGAIAALTELKESGEEYRCSYGTSDLDAAMRLSEETLAVNPYAKIRVYTDKSYQYTPESITVVPVRGQNEWNAAILDAHADLDDGFYQLTVELACYGADREVELNVQVHGANAIDATTGGRELPIEPFSVMCDGDRTKTVIFRYFRSDSGDDMQDTQDVLYCRLDEAQRFYTFRSIEVYVEEDDSLKVDNSFYLYGGLKEVVKVQYSSGHENQVGVNPFVYGVLPVMQRAFADRWDIQVTEVQQGWRPATEGFDVYIFEHYMPESLPVDGVTILLDPLGSPVGSDIMAMRENPLGRMVSLKAEMPEHPLMQNVLASEIQISNYVEIGYSDDYDVLMTCNNAPVFLARNDKDVKTAIMCFSIHNSNLALQPVEWVPLWYNLFDYFLPSTVVGTCFNVNENVTIHGRGPSVMLSSEQGIFEPFEFLEEELPCMYSFDTPGTYNFDVTTYYGNRAQDKIFVRAPAAESNINVVEEALADPFAEQEIINLYDDLLVWFAAVLVALLFAEWALHSREKS